MAEELDLIAEFRTDTGKGSSRRLRRAGKVPAIIYGAGREPRALTFDHNELLKAAEHESFFSSVLNVQVGENVRPSILKDIQVHPAKRQILHIDLQRIVEGEKIRMTVPIHYINEDHLRGRQDRWRYRAENPHRSRNYLFAERSARVHRGGCGCP